jgi:RNA polymerase sigma-70 factor (ECF subfamily)
VVSLSDGGGVVRASKFPVVGRERVARFIRAFANHFWAGVTVEVLPANGQVSALLSRDGKPYAVVTVIASADGIGRVLWMMNPHKLGNLVA